MIPVGLVGPKPRLKSVGDGRSGQYSGTACVERRESGHGRRADPMDMVGAKSVGDEGDRKIRCLS